MVSRPAAAGRGRLRELTAEGWFRLALLVLGVLVVAAALVVLAGADDELEELPLEHAVTAARPMAVSAATPLAAAILRVIWVSFRKGWFIRSWPACAGRPG